MAGRLLSKSTVLISNNSNLRSFAQGLQAAFSSGAKWGGFGGNSSGFKDDTITTEMEATVWPDPYLGILGPNDRRLTLPGNIGLGQNLSYQKTSQIEVTPKVLKDEDNILTCQLAEDRHRSAVNQFFNHEDMEDNLDTVNSQSPIHVTLECIAQECPKLLQKDFSDLFPTMHLTTGPFTVVTMSQRTKNDMTAWSESVEVEREELMLYFVIAAEEICTQLKAQGFWADFIDPSSGRPYLGNYTSATLFETDDRYRHFGFKIEDLGCCKVVSHRKWNTNVFVGCLFTNAPVTGSHIKSIIDRHNSLTESEK